MIDLDDVYIFDIETNGLIEIADRIHVLSIGKVNKKGKFKVHSTTDYDEMRSFFLDTSLIKVCHNAIRYDHPVLEKILDIQFPVETIIDTLPLSWYVWPEILKPGLESFGEMFGIPKPVIEDWNNLSIEDYKHRCQEDIKINNRLYRELLSSLRELYDNNDEDVAHCIEYLNFKSRCVRTQEEIGVRFDKELCEENLSRLEAEKENKISQLKTVMPPVDIIRKVKRPKTLVKKNGEVSVAGLKWKGICEAYGVGEDYEEEFEIVDGHNEPNPQSTSQLKDFLYSLGWEPCTFTFTRNKETNEFKQTPQVFNKDTGEVTNSVKLLFEKQPVLKALDSLGKVKHRIGLLKGFLESAVEQTDGSWRLYPTIAGYTSTLRMKHKTIVNLPKVTVYLGEAIRGCLIADEGHVLCGADLSNIESVTKNNYIYSRDEGYVHEMSAPDFDAHLDMAEVASFITHDEHLFYKWYKEQKH